MPKTSSACVPLALLLFAASCATAVPRAQGPRPVDGWHPEAGSVADAPVSASPGGDFAPLASDAVREPARERVTHRLRIEGMTCPKRCEREVKEMLAKVPGLLATAVDVPTRTVTVDVEQGTDSQLLVAAIKSPYRARLL